MWYLLCKALSVIPVNRQWDNDHFFYIHHSLTHSLTSKAKLILTKRRDWVRQGLQRCQSRKEIKKAITTLASSGSGVPEAVREVDGVARVSVCELTLEGGIGDADFLVRLAGGGVGSFVSASSFFIVLLLILVSLVIVADFLALWTCNSSVYLLITDNTAISLCGLQSFIIALLASLERVSILLEAVRKLCNSVEGLAKSLQKVLKMFGKNGAQSWTQVQALSVGKLSFRSVS